MIPTILLVMDEGNPRYTETLRQYRVRLTQRIFDEGWQVATASGVAQALAQLEAQKISLLVFDTTGYRGDRRRAAQAAAGVHRPARARGGRGER